MKSIKTSRNTLTSQKLRILYSWPGRIQINIRLYADSKLRLVLCNLFRLQAKQRLFGQRRDWLVLSRLVTPAMHWNYKDPSMASLYFVHLVHSAKMGSISKIELP